MGSAGTVGKRTHCKFPMHALGQLFSCRQRNKTLTLLKDEEEGKGGAGGGEPGLPNQLVATATTPNVLVPCPPTTVAQGGGKNAVAGIGKKCGKMRKKCGKCEKKCGIKCGFAKML